MNGVRISVQGKGFGIWGLELGRETASERKVAANVDDTCVLDLGLRV